MSFNSPGRIGPVSDISQCRPAVPGDMGLGPRACGVDRLFRGTRARVRGPTGSTSCPVILGPGSKGPCGRPAVPGTRACVQGTMGSTRCPGRLSLESDGPWGPPYVPGDIGPCPRARGFDQVSLATHAWVELATGLTSIPGGLALVSECPRCRPDVFCNSGPWPGACGVYQISQATQARARVPAVSTNSPKQLEFGSKGPRSTCCPGHLGPMPDVPLCLPGVPGNSGSSRRDHGVDQLSRVTRAWVRGPMCSTSPSGQIALRSNVPRG